MPKSVKPSPPPIEVPPGFALITTERLKRLEKWEAKKKIQDAKSLARLLKKKEESPVPIHVPAPSTQRVLKHIAKNREAYNARRRELRKLKKEAAEQTAEPVAEPVAEQVIEPIEPVESIPPATA